MDSEYLVSIAKLLHEEGNFRLECIAQLEALVPPGARVMTRFTIDRFVVNPPCEGPAEYWRDDRTTRLLDLVPAAAPPDTSSPPRTPLFGDSGALLSTVRPPLRRQAADRPP